MSQFRTLVCSVVVALGLLLPLATAPLANAQRFRTPPSTPGGLLSNKSAGSVHACTHTYLVYWRYDCNSEWVYYGYTPDASTAEWHARNLEAVYGVETFIAVR